MMDKGTMLKLKCADLIAMDRAGTPRDDGYHKYMREHYMRAEYLFFQNLNIAHFNWWM
jgi:hypothetical protein